MIETFETIVSSMPFSLFEAWSYLVFNQRGILEIVHDTNFNSCLMSLDDNHYLYLVFGSIFFISY